MAAAVSLLCRVTGCGGCRWVRLTPLCPAGHLPHRWGDRQDALPPLHPRPLSWSRPRGISISLLVGEMPGRAEGGKRHTPKRGYFPYRFSCSTIVGLRGRPFPVVRFSHTKNPRLKAEDDSWSARWRHERTVLRIHHAQGARCFQRFFLHRFLDLLEGANLDLADAFAADVEL